MPTLAVNKQATFHYNLLEEYEAGLVLSGNEVKSIKQGKISLKGSYISIQQTKTGVFEAFLINANVSPYQPKNTPKDYVASKPRKLLLKKKEIHSLLGKIRTKGLTLIPLSVYTKHGKIKLKFALGRGKKKADKREAMKKRDIEKKIREAMKRQVY